jgi:TonB family protein
VAIHAAVLGGGACWTLLHRREARPSGDVLTVWTSVEQPEPEAPEDVPSPAELPEVELPEPEPETLPEMEQPSEAPPEDELPPIETPHLREPPPPLLPTLDLADRATRRRAPQQPAPVPTPRPPVTVSLPRAPLQGDRAPLRPLRTPLPPFPRHLVPVATTVVLSLTYTIAPDGTIHDAVVSQSSGYPEVDARVRDFVLRNWRYAPPGTVRRVLRRFVFEPGA